MAEKPTQHANTLGRLNESLFAELDRIESVDAGDADALRAEISRANAIQGIAREINASAQTILKSAEFRAEWAGAKTAKMPKMLEG